MQLFEITDRQNMRYKKIPDYLEQFLGVQHILMQRLTQIQLHFLKQNNSTVQQVLVLRIYN